MTLLYADTSVLVGAYFRDEPEHLDLLEMLLQGHERVISSEIARIELASAVMAGYRSGRLPRWRELLNTIEHDCRDGGPILIVRLRPETIVPAASLLVTEHRLRTLDAIHLAVAMEEGPRLAAGEEIHFVTRDRDQAAAARALGLTVR